MKQIRGTSNRVLEIDLTHQTHKIYEVTRQERRQFLGGKGLGLKLLFDRMMPGSDPWARTILLPLCPVF